jgi:hypothetical protein
MNLPNIQIKKILYATDLSENAVHAFSYAVSLANMYGAGITILHVLAEFPGEEFIANMINTDTWEAIKGRHYSDARNQLIGKKRDSVGKNPGRCPGSGLCHRRSFNKKRSPRRGYR